MRKYLLITFVLLLIIEVQAQHNYPSYIRNRVLYKESKQVLDFVGKITYDMKFRVTDDDTSLIKTERMELLYNDSISVFQNVRKGIKDSVLNNSFEQNQKLSIPSELSLLNENLGLTSLLILKNKNNVLVQDNYSHYLETFDKLLLYEEKVDLNWELTKDTMHILNYVCQKAMVNYAGRNWIAWFAPQIPLFDGPYKFTGLPGLILKINDTENRWQFDCIGIENVERKIVLMGANDRKKKTVSKQEFFKTRKNYLANQVFYDEKNFDFMMIDNPDLKNKMDKFYRDRNKRLNHLEKDVL